MLVNWNAISLLFDGDRVLTYTGEPFCIEGVTFWTATEIGTRHVSTELTPVVTLYTFIVIWKRGKNISFL